MAASAVLGAGVVLVLARRSRLPADAAEGANVAPPAAARKPRFLPSLFSSEQALLVEDLAELIIPETELAGALGAGVPAYIEGIVREVYDEAERSEFLKALDATSNELRAGVAREVLVAEGLDRCAPSFETGEPWCFFQAFRALCIEGFCQSEVGATRLLQYESIPGQFRGCVLLSEVGRAWATS